MTWMEQLKQQQPILWENPHVEQVPQTFLLDDHLIDEAEARLERFAPYFEVAFPETKPTKGIIESPITVLTDQTLLKRDDILPVSGSIKARGGIHEVLLLAEQIARAEQLLTDEDYRQFATIRIQEALARHTIIVGSTGNLGLSIGIMSKKLGFQVVVHMSHDAKQWKKDMLRAHGAEVVEHAGDYSVAVRIGRLQAEAEPLHHFIDDENSQALFAGYAVAARRLKQQLTTAPTVQNPLIVYVPCGVGGGPGGVIYGLKQQFGATVKCYMVEPTASPCMLLGMATGKHDQISVQDIGLTNETIADGLAVGRASQFVGRLMEPLLDGILTVTDDMLRNYVRTVWEREQIFLEPSATAGFAGLDMLRERYPTAQHLVWATGGGLVPTAEKCQYFA